MLDIHRISVDKPGDINLLWDSPVLLMPRLGLYEKVFRRRGGGVLSSFKIQYKLCTSQVAATVVLYRRLIMVRLLIVYKVP